MAQPGRALQEELDTLRREQEKMRRAVFEAADVQRKLCAPRELRRGAFEVAGEIFPVRHLSGDFFKAFDLDSKIGLALGDIAGKGLSAGLWLAHLLGLIRIAAREHPDPAAAAAAINRELCEGRDEAPLTALLLGRIDTQSGELVYCNAGQPAALLLRRSGGVEWLQEGGPVLGALREARFVNGRVTLGPGDTLSACSDGVTECRNAQDEEFGIERLAAAVGAAGGVNPSQALFSMLGTVLDFAGGRSPADDLSLLVVRRSATAALELPAREPAEDVSELRKVRIPGVRMAKAARSGMVFDPLG